MNKKVAGLPLYIWIGIAVVGIGAGLYLHSRNKKKEEEPKGEEKPSSVSNAYDTGNPCDPASSSYEPAACQGGYGSGYPGMPYYGYGPEAGSTIPNQPESSPKEKKSGEEGGIIPSGQPGQQTTITINPNEGTPVGKSRTPTCKQSNKPKHRKGFKIVCINGRWAYEPNSHAGSQKRNAAAQMTGGGPPSADASEKLVV